MQIQNIPGISAQIHGGSHRDCEIEPMVLGLKNSFLVIDANTGEEVEVLSKDELLTCDCFLAQVAPESPCEHIRAVEGYLSMPDRKMQLSQADADIFLSRVAKIDNELDSDEQSAQEQIDKIQLWLE